MTVMRIVGVVSAVAVLGSVTFGSGCSSSTSAGNATGPGTDASTNDSSAPPITDATTEASSKDTGAPKDTGGGGDVTGSQDAAGFQDGGDGGDAALPQCSAPASTASFKPAAYVPAIAHQGVCTAAQISTFVTACGYDQGAQNTCTTWQEANVAGDGGAGNSCGNCILAPMNNGGTWLDPLGMNNAFATLPNYGACIQILDPTSGTACATALNDDQACDGVACDVACEMAGQVNPDAFSTCAMQATGCAMYSTTEMSACAKDLVPDGGGVGNTTCAPSGVSGDPDDDFTTIITLICGGSSDGGSGPTDGGTGPTDGGDQ